MAATAAAVASAKTQVRPPPPSSPFAELLRRSKFASYDPSIRQTYSAPPADAHRGNWGLKRPISLRGRNKFITLPSFEHPAMFIEWSQAETQVRFIRRIEEQDMTPRVHERTPWGQSLGKAKAHWLIDSEFCPGEDFKAPDRKEQLEKQQSQMTIDLEGMGTKGPGQYGPARGPPETGRNPSVTANINAMSPRQFRRYLRKLRKLRPEFRVYLDQLAQDTPETEGALARRSLYEIAQNTAKGYHRWFLQDQLAADLRKPGTRLIEQQPHPNGALMYACPSPLDTHFRTTYQPGIVLHNAPQRRDVIHGYTPNGFAVSFGGLTGVVAKDRAGSARPLFDRSDVDSSIVQESVAPMRLAPLSMLLSTVPQVVGKHANPMDGVAVASEVITEQAGHHLDNPYKPGSREYVNLAPIAVKAAPQSFTKRFKWDKFKKSVKQKQASSNDTVLRRLGGMSGVSMDEPFSEPEL